MLAVAMDSAYGGPSSLQGQMEPKMVGVGAVVYVCGWVGICVWVGVSVYVCGCIVFHYYNF